MCFGFASRAELLTRTKYIYCNKTPDIMIKRRIQHNEMEERARNKLMKKQRRNKIHVENGR